MIKPTTQSVKLRPPTQAGVIVASTVICFSLAAGLSSQNEHIELGRTPFSVSKELKPAGLYEKHMYNKPLGGSYRIIRTSSSEVIILRRGPSNETEHFLVDPTAGTIVGGNIKQIAMKSPYITGYAAPLADMENSEERAGYFVLDTASDQLKDGLSQDSWRLELDKIGWTTPDLKQPL